MPLGPVIGPLVLCGYLVSEQKMTRLTELGVRDSKQLSEERRLELFPQLATLADDYLILSVSAQEIDKLRDVSNLNRLELQKMREIIRAFDLDTVIADAPDANAAAFQKALARGFHGIEVIAEHFADANYPVVSAASVIAKVERDAVIADIAKQYGAIGSGYTSDPRTITFLKKWIKMNNDFPDCVRKSWITAAELKRAKEQKNLHTFVDRV